MADLRNEGQMNFLERKLEPQAVRRYSIDSSSAIERLNSLAGEFRDVKQQFDYHFQTELDAECLIKQPATEAFEALAGIRERAASLQKYLKGLHT
jgi:hypothetical protein